MEFSNHPFSIPKKAQGRFGIGLGQVERGGRGGGGLENSRERTHEMVCLAGLLLKGGGGAERERVRFVC